MTCTYFRNQCFKSAWMTTVMHEGLKFPTDYNKFHSVALINNRDVQWTMGALLHRTRFLPLRYDIIKISIQLVAMDKCQRRVQDTEERSSNAWFTQSHRDYTWLFCVHNLNRAPKIAKYNHGDPV